jgi:3-oxoadipate enol-lactonase
VSNSIQILGPRGNTLSVQASGEGPTLFLLHGFPLDHRMWRSQLDGLRDRLHVVAVHMRGFGSSTLDEPDFTLVELAQDVEFLRQHLSAAQPIWLAGLSMGGYVALEYWRQFSSQLRGLILCNTKPTADNEAGKAGRIAMGQKALSAGTWAAVEPMFAKLLSEQTVASQPELTELVKAMMQDVSPATVDGAQRAMALRHDFTDQLPSIQLPTLVVAGQSDAIAPAADGEAWSSRIPNSRFLVIPSTAHLSPLESPSVFNQAVLDFIFPW